MKDLYIENFKTFLKETEDDTNQRKDIPSPWIGDQHCQDANTSQRDQQIQNNP